MDIFTALQTSVSGLKAQAYALSNISGNIANSQTTGFKRIDTSFVDLISEQSPKHEVAGTVLGQSQLTNALQGNVIATGVPTNMALSGAGFFVVQQPSSDAGGQVSFSGSPLYTRRGDFQQDKDGYLVNGSGGFLMGDTLDPATGQTTLSGPIRIANSALTAHATANITFQGNLPRNPATANAATTGGLYTPTTPTIPPSGAAAFVADSIKGPALTVYSPDGAPLSLTTRWAKVNDANSTTTPPTDATWKLFYADKSDNSSPSTSWVDVGSDFKFNLAGVLTSPTGTKITIPNVTIDGTLVGNPVNFNFGKNGLTSQADSTGNIRTDALTQDGYKSGTLTGMNISASGQVVGTYSNGSTLPLANISIVRFINPDGLKPLSGGTFEQTLDSGTALAGLNGTRVVGGNVEQSNTDIASEFSKMIVTQQAYSANTRVISTAQTMMSDLLNVIR